MSYVLHLCIMALIYILLAYSLNFVIGFCGLLSIAHAAFFGVGAYAGVLTLVKLKLAFPFAIAIAFFASAIIAYLVGLPALKLRGDSFVLVTLGFQMIIFTILYNWIGLTRGPYGISGIPRPTILGIKISSLWSYLILYGIICGLLSIMLFKLYDSPFGLALKALRDNEKAAASLGKPPFNYFLKAFVISGGIAGIAGTMYATYITYIDPTSFTLNESILQIAMLIIGGLANKKGPLVGVVFMILLPEVLRLLGLPASMAANLRQMIYGILLIVFMYFRPQGLWGGYAPE